MPKLTKGDAVKFLDDNSTLLEVLKDNGWVVEGEEVNELDALKSEAEALGLKPHHKAGVEKLKEMIAEAKA